MKKPRQSSTLVYMSYLTTLFPSKLNESGTIFNSLTLSSWSSNLERARCNYYKKER